MAERKPVSKKMRFEVFKRDSFKCQYCGKSAPDVILNVDHIKPVAAGGKNTMTNLITACFDCNMGKKDRLLDDNSMLEKQKKQMEELNERRQQLEMMMKWREELVNLEEEQLEFAASRWHELMKDKYHLNENGKKRLRKLIKKYGLNKVLDALEVASDQYINFVDNKPTNESVELAWSKVDKILAFNKTSENKPYLKDLYYMRGILKNRLSYMNPHIAINLLEKAFLAGASKESMSNFVKSVRNWTDFQNEMERFIESQKDGDEDDS